MKNNTMQYINPREREVVARLAYEKVSIITKEQFDKYFNFPKRAKEKTLFRLKKKGILTAIKRGVYFYSPLESGLAASRDFYDLGFLLREKFNFDDKEQLELFRKKLEEDGFSSDLSKYRVNLGRADKEIDEMMSRIEDELLPVLTLDEQKSFNMLKTLDELNEVFGNIR